MSSHLFPNPKRFPMFGDYRRDGAQLDPHYFAQDLLAAQFIFKQNPQRHIDVGSRIDGFVAHIATFRPIEVCEIRPIKVANKNISTLNLDITDTANVPEEICDSVSSLHVLEHIGLGRYGDELNPDGWLLGIKNLLKMLKWGGYLYISVPVGYQRLEFDRNRIFDVETICGAVSDLANIQQVILISSGESSIPFGKDLAAASQASECTTSACLLIIAIKE